LEASAAMLAGAGLPISPAVKLHQVRCVVAAARRGSFRQAALALNVQQSTVSRCVRDLEDHLGVQIFERRVSGVRLTPAGDQFLQGAELALEHLSRAAGIAGAAGRTDRHVFRIAAVSLPGSGFLPELLQATAMSQPRARLQVQEASSDENLQRLKAGRIDLAVVLGVPKLAGCEVIPLWTEQLFAADRSSDAECKADPVQWRDLQYATLVLPTGELGGVIADRLSANLSARWDGASSMAGTETALRLAALGQGQAILSEGAVDTNTPGVIWRPIAGDVLTVSAVRLVRNEKPVLRRFLALARSMASEFAGKGRLGRGAGVRGRGAIA
jgi:DNA-binding transcriptional LysR family regulator